MLAVNQLKKYINQQCDQIGEHLIRLKKGVEISYDHNELDYILRYLENESEEIQKFTRKINWSFQNEVRNVWRK